MALCINDSGTWRNITTQCVNQSGTWRNIQTGCINQSGTWRNFGFFDVATSPLGSAGEGGFLIFRSSGVAWIVAPSSSEVSRTWYCINNANTRAQQVSGCTGWFVPNCACLYCKGYFCREYWDSYKNANYWTSESNPSNPTATAFAVCMPCGFRVIYNKTYTFCVRSFRCVTY